MITGINHYTLGVKDIDRSFDFYKNALGLKPLCKWPKGAYFLAGDFWFCINLDENRNPIPNDYSTHFAFVVSQENFDQMVSHLKNTAVSAYKCNTSPGDSFYFLDPDGHRLEIHCGDYQSRLETFKKTRTDIEYFI